MYNFKRTKHYNSRVLLSLAFIAADVGYREYTFSILVSDDYQSLFNLFIVHFFSHELLEIEWSENFEQKKHNSFVWRFQFNKFPEDLGMQMHILQQSL